MSSRLTIAREAAAGLRRFAPHAASTPVLVGFDGFVDSIVQVVEKRHDAERYDSVHTIGRLAEKVAAAAGQSSNYELVTTLQKLGGNGPIMANAMASAGLQVTYIGALGYPTLHPIFEQLAANAEVHSVAEPGYTDALEFTDGKLMLGKHDSIRRLNWNLLADRLPEKKFEQIVRRSRMIAMLNWTMLSEIETVWLRVHDLLASGTEQQRSLLFIDLADPEKRTTEDLLRALDFTSRFNKRCRVTLGMNLKEAAQVAQALGVESNLDTEAEMAATAAAIRSKLGLYATVVHPRASASAAMEENGQSHSACFRGPFTRAPVLSTGAGDNFNAGFCLGELAGLSLEQCLCVATATSGFYVRNARSPNLEELADFCENLPEPAGNLC